MAFRAIQVALLLSTLVLAGCGTVANVAQQRPEAGGVIPFGGVKQDVACLQKVASGEPAVRTHFKSGSEHYPRTALMLFCAADLPFSLIGDVVTLPYTVIYSFINQPVPVPPVLQALPPPPPEVPPMPLPTPPAVQETAGRLPHTSPQGP